MPLWEKVRERLGKKECKKQRSERRKIFLSAIKNLNTNTERTNHVCVKRKERGYFQLMGKSHKEHIILAPFLSTTIVFSRIKAQKPEACHVQHQKRHYLSQRCTCYCNFMQL